jgi:hypothetical protein
MPLAGEWKGEVRHSISMALHTRKKMYAVVLRLETQLKFVYFKK